MYFHCDYYTMNYFKLFINLQDISLDHGPLTFYSIEDTKNLYQKVITVIGIFIMIYRLITK